jgi:FkbM family methyltransferase
MANFTLNLTPLAYLEENSVPCYRVKHEELSMSFFMFGETTEFRVRTLFTKEPETIEWIKSFGEGDVFWDIGANIGIYSLYAAAMGMKVRSFEPSPVNFWLLTKNVALNDFKNLLQLYPFAISDANEIATWNPDCKAGSADNQIPANDFFSKQIKKVEVSSGGSVAFQSFTIDHLVKLNVIDFPQHIKIDVDGVEKRIIESAKATLNDMRLRSVLIEIDESDDESLNTILKIMEQSGFRKPVKRHPPYMDDSHYAPVFNYIFYRSEIADQSNL